MAKAKKTAVQKVSRLGSTARALDDSRTELMKAHTFSLSRQESGAMPPADEADPVWQGVGAITPPYEPWVLLTLLEHSNSLRQCVDAYATNIDAFGHRFEPVIDMTASDADDRIKAYLRGKLEAKHPDVVADPTRQVPDPTPEQVCAAKDEIIEKMRDELLQLQHFFEYACLDESFVSLRRKTRLDIETLGNAYWACILGGDGKLAGFEYLPAFTMRHMPMAKHPTPIKMKVKKDLFDFTEVETEKYFRCYVQVFESRVVFFKEFGDPRIISRKTGHVFPSVEALKKQDRWDQPASEVFHFKVHSSKSSYGIPRWIGTILSVIGSRQAEEVNHAYFDNKSVPPLAILVSGGRITNNTVDRIKDFLENDVKGKRNFHKVLVLEAESPGTSSFDNGRMKIDLKPLTAAQHNDALFQQYDQNNIDKVGMSFRLPRMLRGDIRDFNRATADAAIEFAEQQVFRPERDEFDFTMNRKILTAIGAKFWRFKSNAVEGHTASELADILEKLGDVGFITPAEGRDLMERIFNRPFQKIDAPWVRQPIALTTAGIVPPDQLMAPNMTTPQAAATGAVGGQPMAGLQAPGAAGGAAGAPAASPDGAGVSLTGTDTSTVVTVNEARHGMGLGPLQKPPADGGGDDPDGWLTVAEFKAKRMAAGQALGVSVGQGEAKDQGLPVSNNAEAHGGGALGALGATKDDTTSASLAAGGLNIGGLPRRRREDEEKSANPMLAFVRDLMLLRKAMQMVDEQDAEAAFDRSKILLDEEGIEKKGPAELHIEHPDGKIEVTSHPSTRAAREALATHLDANGGKGKAVITKPGNKLGLKPIPVKGGWHNQYGSG